MKRYLIGNLIVDIEADCKRLERLGVPYETDRTGDADITVRLTDEKLNALQQQYQSLTRDELAYLATGSLFYRKLTLFEGMMLHASAIVMDGQAYLFTAPSGIGKSTHTGLWRQMFGDRVTVINDDKPMIRKQNGVYRAFGTPWSGKTDLNCNVSAPLKGIVFLSRGEQNTIRRAIPPRDAVVPLFLTQTVRPRDPERMAAMLQTANEILLSTPLYFLQCNISKEAVQVSYSALTGQTANIGSSTETN